MTSDREFQTTLWSDVSRARKRSRSALDRLLGRYRAPVLAYARRQGLQTADAEDVTQDVFRRIVEDDLLRKADRAKGRFRGLLLGITRNVIRDRRRRARAQKRGGGRADLPLDGDGNAPSLDDLLAAPPEDAHFDRLWVAHLLDEAIRAATRDGAERGAPDLDMLRLKMVNGVSYGDLAQQFGVHEHDVKNALHRARKEIRARLWALIEGYASSLEEYEAEVRFVSRWLERPGKSGPRPAADAT